MLGRGELLKGNRYCVSAHHTSVPVPSGWALRWTFCFVLLGSSSVQRFLCTQDIFEAELEETQQQAAHQWGQFLFCAYPLTHLANLPTSWLCLQHSSRESSQLQPIAKVLADN